jgi:F0F1-type ATP synthase assembly protein I
MADTNDLRSKVENAATQAGDSAQQAAAAAMTKAQELASTASKRVDEATTALGDRVRSAGSSLRERGPHDGMLGTATSTVADSLEHTGRYLQEEGLVGMAEDVTELIRRNPIPAMLVGVGIGYLLAKVFRS